MVAIAELVAMADAKGEPLRIRLARAMHDRHVAESGLPYDQKSEGFQRWMIEQADAAIRELMSCEIDMEEY